MVVGWKQKLAHRNQELSYDNLQEMNLKSEVFFRLYDDFSNFRKISGFKVLLWYF